MISERIPELARLSPDEKLRLAAELFADAEDIGSAQEPSHEVMKLLEQRLEQYSSNPESAVDWNSFREALKSLKNG